MTRRGLLLAAIEPRIPLDMETLNRFAAEYNEYIRRLQAGELAVKQWERAKREWERLR